MFESNILMDKFMRRHLYCIDECNICDCCVLFIMQWSKFEFDAHLNLGPYLSILWKFPTNIFFALLRFALFALHLKDELIYWNAHERMMCRIADESELNLIKLIECR